jgi:hypothetical protein
MNPTPHPRMDAAVPVDAPECAHSDLENRTRRGFPQRPHASSDFREKEEQNLRRQPAPHTKFRTLPGPLPRAHTM